MSRETQGEETPTFEQALEQLEAIVRQLESGTPTLDQSMALFEQGVTLARICSQRLDEAEKRIDVLLEKHGAIAQQPLDREDLEPGPKENEPV